MAEFLGVLTFDQNADENSEALSEAESVQMPSENVPRLHCIIHRKLETQHFLNGSSLSTEASIPSVKTLLLALILVSTLSLPFFLI